MKTKMITVFIFSLCVTFLLFSPAAGKSNPSNFDSKYGKLIDKEISRCDRKAALTNSRSTNIRRSAELSCMKADYFRHHKEELIKAMIKEDMGFKTYKVQYFLNKNFFTAYRQKSPNIAKTNTKNE